jgi:hypothetical protein
MDDSTKNFSFEAMQQTDEMINFITRGKHAAQMTMPSDKKLVSITVLQQNIYNTIIRSALAA